MAGIIPGMELLTPVASHITQRALEWLRSDQTYGVKYIAGPAQLGCVKPNTFDQFIATIDHVVEPEKLDTYLHVADARGILEGTPYVSLYLTEEDYRVYKRKTTRVCRRTVACEECSVHLDAALEIAISLSDRYERYLVKKFQMKAYVSTKAHLQHVKFA